MSLRDWLRNGWLTEHQTGPQEISDLLKAVDRDLMDCRASGLSSDGKLTFAYNAMLKLAATALAAAGYRVTREAHHYRLIQSLQYTMETDRDVISQLDHFRKKRNVGMYERADVVSDQEVREMTALAMGLRKKIKSWLKENYPALLERTERAE